MLFQGTHESASSSLHPSVSWFFFWLSFTILVHDYEGKAVGEDRRVAQDLSRRCWGREGTGAMAIPLCLLKQC